VTITADTPLVELAARVADALAAAGVDAVLSGGAVVSIWSDNAYQSHDLDFITSDSLKRVAAALAALGFSRGKGRHFTHPENPFLLEFPPGPLMIGEDPVRDVAELSVTAGTIRLLTPTDAVRDRLAAFLHWGDRQGLAQARAIVDRQPVDLTAVEAWIEREPGVTADRRAIARRGLRAHPESDGAG